MKKQLTILLMLLFALPGWVSAQMITGTITSADGPVIGASIVAGSGVGTTTDVEGKYSLNLSPGTYNISVSYIGYATQTQEMTLAAGESKTWNVKLEEDHLTLQDIVIVGSRGAPRSSTDTPLPVDMLQADELTSTGQNSFDKALQYRVPSFNTVQTPVNDATSLLDPYEIRNMGPSRTLILINGKRKNLSSLLYTQTSPGRGETGADISSIPTDAIKRVEILRDGASAQYGSDAIAGVMNIILKDDAEEGSVTLRSGITSEGDGEMIGVSLNNGSSLGQGKGFINYTIDLSKVNLANRPGTVDAAGEAADFGANIEDVQTFLTLKPDAGNINGSPETTAAKFAINSGLDLSETTNLYFNAAYIYKKVNSFANYRTPYWRTEAAYPYLADFFPNGPNGTYVGYVPTFDGDLNDYNATVGFKSSKNNWTYDISFTTGGNQQTYTVRNSHNGNDVSSGPIWDDADGNHQVDPGEITFAPLYRENSPISFDPGGTRFSHSVGNIDISRIITDQIGIAFGSEFRSETFEVIEGELASYDGGGADSFAGNRPENSGKFNRYNFGGYVDLAFDITPDFLINGTMRLENYSDFGNAFVWKVSSRYKFLDDKLTIRGSLSTGFRAPTLHQIYTQKAQYSFVPGEGIQVGGLVNNVSPQAKLLGIPQLDAEKSTNFTVGLGAQPSSNFNITVDYYNIAVEDRIVLSTEIGRTSAGNTTLDDVLNENNLSDVSFFVNALDTRTSGVDVVASYRNIQLGNGSLSFNISGNYTIENQRDGAVNNPKIVADAEQSVVNETQEALFFTSRPKTKWIVGMNYDIGKFGFSVNNTYFGKTEFAQQGLQDLEYTVIGFDENDPNNISNGLIVDGKSDLRTEFEPRIVTDFAVQYNATDKITFSFNVNNVLDVLPEWKFVEVTETGRNILNGTYDVVNTPSNLITFNQRYSQMTYDGYHFSQLGRMFSLAVNVRF
ncbi:TonB-dependent receptor [Fulvivirga imtechensis AK7]|uniref:TonB-dependent receptor n=1 Tax=Fulvivirga imtechensis AK7 TaxID=1237149 RepID=L8JNS8_9BACT|nr:TonB-dependent receptor [Fulvivirga imtechensis]ELR70500.1 TonB-dependent receptor [Fulvivirga imtechensis AK7]